MGIRKGDGYIWRKVGVGAKIGKMGAEAHKKREGRRQVGRGVERSGNNYS